MGVAPLILPALVANHTDLGAGGVFWSEVVVGRMSRGNAIKGKRVLVHG